MCKNIIYKGKDQYIVETDGIERPIGPNLLELVKCVYKTKRHRINWKVSLEKLLKDYHKIWEKEFLKNT